MGRILAIFLLSLCAAQHACAGAWLRDKGAGFLSLTGTLYNPSSTYDFKSAVYAEWGVTPKLTVGLDLNERPGLTGHALIFARVPVTTLGQNGRVAFEFGGGGHHFQNRWHPMYKIGLSYGKSLDSRWGSGWLAIDFALEHRTRTSDPFYKLDATVGLSENRRLNPMLQIETAYFENSEFQWSVTPSILIKGKNNRKWQIGIEHRSAYPKGYGLKFALLREF
ncbi:hypothetical protein J7426_11260 [Tropicibacter sp. R16_0]|uniref:hypothetical protein n=1 Tax=Tropicibacter sp. R16_0 TaxID=2821102 RepID=UPI001ADD251A|nr:hypothetical protein [Tropicibacter sp. R16_0]MBO9450840.1 hypothetical protein [Tropicibacter sp. R16_0]